MPSLSPSEQVSLVAQARAGDLASWDRLLAAHQLPIYSYAVELLRDRQAALDIVQESFLASVKGIGGLREEQRFSSWLFGIVHQRCLLFFRRARLTRERFEEAPEDFADSCGDAGDDPRTVLLRSEQAAEYFALVDRLPAAQRSAFLLHVLEDFSLAEIALISGVPEGTVKSRLHHARRALRQFVEELT